MTRYWLIPVALVAAIAAALLVPGSAGSKDATQQFFEQRLLAGSTLTIDSASFHAQVRRQP